MNISVDSHIHIEDADFERAVRFLDGLYEVGVRDAVLLALTAHQKYDILQNFSVLRSKRDYTKTNIRAFGCFHERDAFSHIPYEKQLERMIDMGFDGVKFIQMKPNVRKYVGRGIDHPDYDTALSIMEERGIPVTLHSGDPEEFWDINKISPALVARGWYYGDGSFLSREEHYAEVYRMLDKHPRLRISIAHFFFLSNFYDDAVRLMEKYPAVRLDLTPGWEMYLGFSRDLDRWRDFFITYQDRIMFGTDSNSGKADNPSLYRLVYEALTHSSDEFPMPAYHHPIIRGLDLPKSVTDKIFYDNYYAFVGERAKIPEGALESVAERMLATLKNIPDEKSSADILKAFLAG